MNVRKFLQSLEEGDIFQITTATVLQGSKEELHNIKLKLYETEKPKQNYKGKIKEILGAEKPLIGLVAQSIDGEKKNYYVHLPKDSKKAYITVGAVNYNGDVENKTTAEIKDVHRKIPK